MLNVMLEVDTLCIPMAAVASMDRRLDAIEAVHFKTWGRILGMYAVRCFLQLTQW